MNLISELQKIGLKTKYGFYRPLKVLPTPYGTTYVWEDVPTSEKTICSLVISHVEPYQTFMTSFYNGDEKYQNIYCKTIEDVLPYFNSYCEIRFKNLYIKV